MLIYFEKLATYKFQMKPIGDTENGNKKITISIHVDCQDGQPANGVAVRMAVMYILSRGGFEE